MKLLNQFEAPILFRTKAVQFETVCTFLTFETFIFTILMLTVAHYYDLRTFKLNWTELKNDRSFKELKFVSSFQPTNSETNGGCLFLTPAAFFRRQLQICNCRTEGSRPGNSDNKMNQKWSCSSLFSLRSIPSLRSVHVPENFPKILNSYFRILLWCFEQSSINRWN